MTKNNEEKIKKQNVETNNISFLTHINNRTQMGTKLFNLLCREHALSLKHYLETTFIQEHNLYGIPVSLALTNNMVLGRDFVNCLAISTYFTNFKIITANLVNFSSHYHVECKMNNYLFPSVFNFNEHSYLEVDDYVIFPTLNLLLNKQDFIALANPEVIFTIKSKDLMKSKIYKNILMNRFESNDFCKSLDFIHISAYINMLFENVKIENKGKSLKFNIGYPQKLKKIDTHIYNKIMEDKALLVKRLPEIKNNIIQSNFDNVYNFFLLPFIEDIA